MYDHNDLILDVISCCVWSCRAYKINVCDNIVIETSKKVYMWKSKNFVHKSPSKRLFRNGIHSLLRRADARGSADIIYRMW